MRFGERDCSWASAFDWQRSWVARPAEFLHRTDSAAWIARRANKGSKIHHGGLEFSRGAGRHDLLRALPQFRPAGGGIDRLT